VVSEATQGESGLITSAGVRAAVDNAVSASVIVSAIDGADINPGTISGTSVVDAISGNAIAPNSITGTSVVNAISGVSIAPGAITGTSVVDAIDSAVINPSTISGTSVVDAINGSTINPATISGNSVIDAIDGSTINPTTISGSSVVSAINGASIQPSTIDGSLTVTGSITSITSVVTTKDQTTDSPADKELVTKEYVASQSSGGSAAPTGSVMSFLGSTDPSGWVICDGVSRDNSGGTYDALIALSIGTEVGSNYVPPDLTDKFLYGTDTPGDVGNTAGASSVTLTSSNIPSHNHTGTTSTAGNHRHMANYVRGFGGSSHKLGVNDGGGDNQDDLDWTVTDYAGNHNHSFTTSTAYTASPTAVSIIPPAYRVLYILKT
jgi:hypothetical protein